MDGYRPDRHTQQAIASRDLDRFNSDMPISTANTALIPRTLRDVDALVC
jgi:hypothetical protein